MKKRKRNQKLVLTSTIKVLQLNLDRKMKLIWKTISLSHCTEIFVSEQEVWRMHYASAESVRERSFGKDATQAVWQNGRMLCHPQETRPGIHAYSNFTCELFGSLTKLFRDDGKAMRRKKETNVFKMIFYHYFLPLLSSNMASQCCFVVSSIVEVSVNKIALWIVSV